MRKAVRLAIGAVLVFSFTHCSSRVVLVRGGPTPAWVDRLPKRAGELCAVGYSGPTFYQPDCVKNAAENARGHLAESITVTIRAVTIDISDGTRGYFSKDVFVEGNESASEAVLQGSELEAQWLDMQGQRGAQNGCYALVCIDPSKPIDKFVEKLQEKKLPPKTVEKVRENAAAAFEELEKLEEKAEQKKVAPPPAPPAEEKPAPPAETAPDAKEGEDSGAEKPEAPATENEDDTTKAVRKIELPSE